MSTIETKIAGLWSYPEAKEPMKQKLAGEPYAFQREPENQYDANAIALFERGEITNAAGDKIGVNVKCGYVPKSIAAQLQNLEIESIVKGSSFDGLVITYSEKAP